MNSKNKIVLLDLGGVVFDSTGKASKKIDWKIITILNQKYGAPLNLGEDFFPLFISDYNQLTKQSLTGIEFLTLVFDTLEMNTELIKLLDKDYRIFILSDNYRENINYISKRYNFSGWSEKQYYSFDFKMEKNNPAFFKALLKELNEDPANILFIDDYDVNIKNANDVGIYGVLYTDNEQLRKDLINIK